MMDQVPQAGWYPDPAGSGHQRWWDGAQWGPFAPPPQFAPQAPGPFPPGQPIMVVTSRDDGRNATVTLWPDRIERVKAKKMMSVGRAHQDVEVTPIRSVSSVQAQKDGMAWTKVTVYASGNTIEFRVGHAQAAAFRDAITQLIL
jgi:hypothetical protein